MRLIKMASLAAVAVVAAMAFIGASSAMAGNTQICSSDPAGGTCPAGTAVTSVHYTDPSALLFAELFGVKKDIDCEALFSGTVLGLGAPQIIHGNFTYSNCIELISKEKCTSVKEVSKAGLLKVLRTGNETGEVTGETFEVLVECAGLHCVYNATGLKGTASGSLLGGNGNVSTTNATVNKVSGFLCPSVAKLTSKFESLTPTYLGV